MNAIGQMRDEHCAIKEMLKVLGVLCERMENGEVTNPEDGKSIVEFLRIYADRFHHEKEEQLIFPLLEKLGVPKAGGPVEIMLEDHALGRADLRAMSEALESFSAGDREAIASFARSARSYIHLLTEHIKTEDDAIFDMAEMRLSAAQLDQLAAEFVTVEKMTLGADGRETLHLLLDRLKSSYLS